MKASRTSGTTESMATPAEAYRAWKSVLLVQARMVAELEKRTESAGVLPPSWLDLLLKLSHAQQQRLRLSDLAGWAVLTRGGVSRLVARIEAAGLLRREAVEADGRGTFAVLTPAGTQALEQAQPVYREVLTECFAGYLTAGQADAIAGGLEAIIRGNDWGSALEEPSSGW